MSDNTQNDSVACVIPYAILRTDFSCDKTKRVVGVRRMHALKVTLKACL